MSVRSLLEVVNGDGGLAQTAENNGFDYALSQMRYEASYGAEYQHESTSFSLAPITLARSIVR